LRARCDELHYPFACWPIALLHDAIAYNVAAADRDYCVRVPNELCSMIEEIEVTLPADAVVVAFCRGAIISWTDRGALDIITTLINASDTVVIRRDAINWFLAQAELYWNVFNFPEYSDNTADYEWPTVADRPLIAWAFDLLVSLTSPARNPVQFMSARL
jgi:hypothetical protein